ncbi:MAG: protein phosphatase 2C domain-containing protein [Proteobacteria bacterium]|nr:protein phosphatase 2C domain-containing protein [Pseudomonadota bacterium]
MNVTIEKKEYSSVAWIKGKTHPYYEDSFRLLSRDIGLVETVGRGEIFAVFDGIGSTKHGRHSAQKMAESLLECFRHPEKILKNRESLYTHLFNTNMEIASLDTDSTGYYPDVGCVGTVLWIMGNTAHIFHAGDTAAVHVVGRKKGLLTTTHQTSEGYVTRYFGQGSSFHMDVQSMILEEGDRIYLMSDGVSKVIHPADAALSYDESPDLIENVRTITKKALHLGSTDDITVLCVDIEEIWE